MEDLLFPLEPRVASHLTGQDDQIIQDADLGFMDVEIVLVAQGVRTDGLEIAILVANLPGAVDVDEAVVEQPGERDGVIGAGCVNPLALKCQNLIEDVVG